MLQASFITEFGLEHGLPEVRDPTAEAMLSDFLLRVTEWGRRDRASAERVKSLNLEGQVPPGPGTVPPTSNPTTALAESCA